MKVLLIKDVYKLGRAGEVKKVAAGYGRNYLIPKGFAIPVTKSTAQQADRIKIKATERRAALNEALADVADVLGGKTLTFPVKAGETGHLYGSVSSDDIIEIVKNKYQIDLERRQVETEPIRQLGTYKIPIHLTMDLVPEITVIVHREGEAPEKLVEAPITQETKQPAVELQEPDVMVSQEVPEPTPEEDTATEA